MAGGGEGGANGGGPVVGALVVGKGGPQKGCQIGETVTGVFIVR